MQLPGAMFVAVHTVSLLTVRLLLVRVGICCCPHSDSECECAADRGSADAERCGDGVEALALLAESAGKFGAFGCHDGGPAAVSALSAGDFGAGVGPFDDHAAFHLGEGCHDVEEEFAACGVGVESFCEGTECDASLAEVVDGVDDVADGSSEAIETVRSGQHSSAYLSPYST